MINKIRTLIVSISAMFMFAVPLAIPAAVSAQAASGAADIQNSLCGGANELKVNTAQDCQAADITGSGGGFNAFLAKIINVFSIVVGVIAVIMIIVGGFRYITSGGKQESVSGAKTTIMYAIIGLVIVALAQLIVRFVLDKAINATP